MEPTNDRFSIKTLLFTKAIPNYVIPPDLMTHGHKLYSCTDCGDKFVFESSYNDHVNRKSAQITYMCRYCNQKLIFFNRCNMLSHIRSHVSKTATINVTDLNIEPLPASYFKVTKPSGSKPPTVSCNNNINPTQPAETTRRSTSSIVHCFECKSNITVTGIAYKDRANHLMQYTNEVFSCPICLFALPTTCALKTHVRIHTKLPPFYCPECGIQLATRNTNYPYHHDCEGFKMMRATARLKCVVPECRPLHPNDYKDHMKELHLKKVFKCPFCVVACFNETTMENHLKNHKMECKPLLFYQCEMCPGRFVVGHHLESHLLTHPTPPIYPCWPCGATFKDINNLINHYIRKESKSEVINEVLRPICKEFEVNFKPKYRVVKRCDQCKRSFAYRCKYREIADLPNECPFKCKSMMESNVTLEVVSRNTKINCHLCKLKMSQDWSEVKKHYAKFHKSIKCLDPTIRLNRIDIRKYLPLYNSKRSKPTVKASAKKIKKKDRKVQQTVNLLPSIEKDTDTQSTSSSTSKEFECNVCHESFDSKLSLEKHMIIHRDPCMAYQCMECAQSFVVKPSFEKHLLLEHNITDVEEYIKSKQCYNEIALIKYQDSIISTNELLSENQCRICLEEFNAPEDLEKHFRVHGMAFLIKNNSNKNK